MKKRNLLVISTIGAALLLVMSMALLVSPAVSQGISDEGESSTEDLREEIWISESQPAGGAFHLFVSPDNLALPAHQIGVTSSAFITSFVGWDGWGAAYDPVGEQVYHNDGSTMYSWPLTGAPAELGIISDTAASPLTIHGLAFYDGTLYGSSISTDVIYTIDTSTLVATPYITLVDGGASISGLAIDPNTGEMYGTDDGTNDGLVRINLDGSLTLIAAYLDGETDVDGLAINNESEAYLITDDLTPPYFNVYDLNSLAYTGVVSSPYQSDFVQVGGAWIEDESIPEPDPLVCNGPAVEFEQGIPSDWTDVVWTGAVYWSTTDDLAACDNGGNQTLGSGEAACADSDNTNVAGDPYDAELFSNSFDLTDITGASLAFAASYNDILTADRFEVWVWDAGVGSLELSWDEDHNEIVTLDLSTYVGRDDVSVSFRYVGEGWDWWAQVDDVSLICTGAPEIEVLPDNILNEQGTNTLSTHTLTISNTGEVDLDWVIVEEANAQAADLPDRGTGNPERLGTTTPVDSSNESRRFAGQMSADVIQDGGFESGTPNPFWNESSTNFGTPLCNIASCGVGGGTGPFSGDWWAWFGGVSGVGEDGSVDQDVTIPAGVATLSYWLEIPVADTTGSLLVEIDGNVLATYTEADLATYGVYQEVVHDVSAYADGGVHNIAFVSSTDAGPGPLNFFVDDVALDVDDSPSTSCDAPGDIPWLSAAPASGTTPFGDSDNVTVTLDSTGLAPNTYEGILCIESNDPDDPVLRLPVKMIVAMNYAFMPYMKSGS